jgi:nicotinamide-nucleotide amidase
MTGKAASYTFKILGLSESELDRVLKLVNAPEHAGLRLRADFPHLTLRLSVAGEEPKSPTFEDLRRRIRTLLGTAIYSEEDSSLEEIVGQRLAEKGHTVALAESCTGGYISHRITRIAGSSAYYYGGVVTYSNEAKMAYLGVRADTLKRHGAVSRETAEEMSAAIRERSGASIGLSVTGIAGPAGGSSEKPVGTVWISICQEHLHEARPFRFHGRREQIIFAASEAALKWLCESLL